jgi:GT2 family glycosyltransferase
MLKKEVSLIIIHYNTFNLLKEQLKLFIFSQKNKNFKNQIIVVDNNSLREDEKEKLKFLFKEVDFIFNKKNEGFGRGVNLGVKQAKFENILILNPDILLTQELMADFLKKFEKSGFNAVSPKPDSIDYQKPLPSFFSLLAEFTFFKKIISLNFFKSKTLTGGCLLIKKETFNKINGFDPDYFLWFEDSDFTKKLIDNKFQIGFLPVKIKHLGGVSFKKMNDLEKNKIFFTSLVIYCRKHLTIFSQLLAQYLYWKFVKLKPFLNRTK